ncbi:MAG: site-specific integrase, partial [Candidatus Bathyarchaeota archaeon]|nr:site-specific integrase [Candidatus Bathyarchaeota archaeon]
IWAERREYVLRSPHRALSDFRQPIPQPKEALTRAEIRQLILSLTPDTDLERAVIIALHTAMRLNEIVQLRWEDVDLESDLIQLKATKAGRRQSVPISTELKKHMLEWKSQGLPKPILFAHKSNVSQQYSKLRDELGFAQEKTFHSLRRTAATQLLANGESMFYVSKLLRHSSVAVTEAYYAHVVPKRLKSTADTLASIIQRDV